MWLCRVQHSRPYPGNHQHHLHTHEALPAPAASAWLPTFYPIGEADPPAGEVSSPLLLGLECSPCLPCEQACTALSGGCSDGQCKQHQLGIWGEANMWGGGAACPEEKLFMEEKALREVSVTTIPAQETTLD